MFLVVVVFVVGLVLEKENVEAHFRRRGAGLTRAQSAINGTDRFPVLERE